MILLRSALFNAWFFFVTFVLCLVGVVVRAVSPAASLRLAQVWAGQVLAAARVICGIRYEVTGWENLPRSGAALVACQHQSAFDTLVWLRLTPNVSYVVKAELGRLPLFGPLLREGGQILVERTAGVAAIRQLVDGAKRAAADGRTIVIFPEGTRVETGEKVPLRAGIAVLAARLHLPVVPVTLDSGLLWGRRAFRKRPGVIQLRIGAPIPSDLRRDDMLAAIEHAWAAEAPAQGQAAGQVAELCPPERLQSAQLTPSSEPMPRGPA